MRAVEICLSVMLYISNFIKTGSGIQTFMEVDSHTIREHGDPIGPHSFIYLFFQNKESRLNSAYMSFLFR
jgi:hypothetical protein